VRMAHWFASPSWASIYVSQISGAQTLLALLILTAIVAWLKHGTFGSAEASPSM